MSHAGDGLWLIGERRRLSTSLPGFLGAADGNCFAGTRTRGSAGDAAAGWDAGASRACRRAADHHCVQAPRQQSRPALPDRPSQPGLPNACACTLKGSSFCKNLHYSAETTPFLLVPLAQASADVQAPHSFCRTKSCAAVAGCEPRGVFGGAPGGAPLRAAGAAAARRAAVMPPVVRLPLCRLPRGADVAQVEQPQHLQSRSFAISCQAGMKVLSSSGMRCHCVDDRRECSPAACTLSRKTALSQACISSFAQAHHGALCGA